MQELDAERRAAILRGRTPPPLPDEVDIKNRDQNRERGDRGHDRKRRKLAGEDDTDMDIRLAASIAAPKDDTVDDAKVLKLRNTKIDAPLTDHAGNIDLFPIDHKEAMKREKNADVEKEKRRKERALEDQYTMRFSNAAGRGGLEQPWYSAKKTLAVEATEEAPSTALIELENKNVWGNEDPRRKEREQARINSSDPFAFMQQAQAQLKRSKEDKKKWAAERDRELRELRATQEREDRRKRHHKRKHRDDDGIERAVRHSDDNTRALKHQHRHRHSSRSRSQDRSAHTSVHRHDRRRSRDRSRHRERRGKHEQSSQRSRDEAERPGSPRES
tara:strand:+ start:14146 stop:15138 length:993 start_codon:yes stop_codon:yes gene_type:complete